MKMNDLYEKFAYDYDEFGLIEDYLGSEKEFFKFLFKKNSVKTVLDCACGTGQHLYMLSDLGFEVMGSDFSESMLKVAKENLKKLDKQIKLCQCDFRYLEQRFTEKFDSVICLTSALPHLHTNEDLLTALNSMRERLNPNGLLVLTQGTTHFTLTMPSVEVVINRSDFSRIFVKEHDDEFLNIKIIDLFHSGARTEENQYDIKYRILLDDDYRELLSKAGFNKIMIYGGYDMAEYNKDNSLRLIVVAQK